MTARRTSRRTWIGAVAAAVALGWAATGPASAQGSYPDRPIRIVVPVAPGGGTDFVARLLAEKLAPALGQPVLVDNRPGGSGNVGVRQVVEAAADGYTLVMPITSLPISPSLQKLPFNPVKDLAPITLAGNLPLVLVVHPSLPATSVREVIALAKAKPRTLNFANSGVGTTAHLAGELFNRMAGVEMVSVNYKGGGPAVTDLLGGHVQLYFSTIPSVIQHVKSGKLRAIAVTGRQRSSEMPEVPTVIESGLRDFEVTSWFGLFAPAGTPRAVIDRLNREAVAALALPDVKQKMAGHGVEAASSTPEALAQLLASEIERWGKVIREAGIKAE
jgi:tripartite-type tricarboxylate transporter receptor subunit TctC